MNALTTFPIVSSDQSCSGSFSPNLSRQRATTAAVLPYPENWFCNVSTAVASEVGRSVSDVIELMGQELTHSQQHDAA